jgi:hypothetical protein
MKEGADGVSRAEGIGRTGGGRRAHTRRNDA